MKYQDCYKQFKDTHGKARVCCKLADASGNECGYELAPHASRQKSHLLGDMKDLDYPNYTNTFCKNVQEEQRREWRQSVGKKETPRVKQLPPAGYAYLPKDKNRVYHDHYAFNATESMVVCLWCDRRFGRNEALMRGHLLGGEDIALCPTIDMVALSELRAALVTSASQIDDAAKAYVAERLGEGASREEVEALWHSDAFENFVVRLSEIPRLSGYKRKGFEFYLPKV